MTRDELIEVLDRDIRALSIRQPWCHNILHDGKIALKAIEDAGFCVVPVEATEAMF